MSVPATARRPHKSYETRLWSLTPEGAQAVSRADAARSAPATSSAQPSAAPSGHSGCRIWCGIGCLPSGWVREGAQ